MKKGIALLLLVSLLAALFAGCAEEAEAPVETTPALSVEQKVLFEKPYAVVSSEDLLQNEDEYILNLSVKNLGTERINIGMGNVAVNGLTVPSKISDTSVQSKSQETVAISMDCSSLFLWGMDKLATIDFTMGLHTEYSYDEIPVSIAVTQEGTKGTLEMDGQTILEHDGMTMQYKIVDNWPVILMVNHSDREMIVDEKDFTINGITKKYMYTFERDRAQAGESVVTSPKRVTGIYLPKADTLNIAFNVIVNAHDNTYEAISERVSYEAPFFFEDMGLNEQFFTIFESELVKVQLGYLQRYQDEPVDLCIRIRNDSDEKVVVTVNQLTIDGRNIELCDTKKDQDQYYFEKHSVDPHAEDIQALTTGFCGTPEMYGGTREVYIPISVYLESGSVKPDTVTNTVQFP